MSVGLGWVRAERTELFSSLWLGLGQEVRLGEVWVRFLLVKLGKLRTTSNFSSP